MNIYDELLTRARNLERYPFESATMAEAGRLAANALRNIASGMKDFPPCELCDDSGYVERFSGVWGRTPRSSFSICDCPCGDDVRRERASQDGESA
jgi:hypothetical protein